MTLVDTEVLKKLVKLAEEADDITEEELYHYDDGGYAITSLNHRTRTFLVEARGLVLKLEKS